MTSLWYVGQQHPSCPPDQGLDSTSQRVSRSGPIGPKFVPRVMDIVIAMFVRSDQEKLYQRRFQCGQMNKYLYCKEYIKLGATVCRHRHKPVAPALHQ